MTTAGSGGIYFPDAEKAYKEGKKDAIWSNAVGWQVPLVYSVGITPVSYNEIGRLSDKDAMQIAEDHYQFPVETCSMVKCKVGQWHLRRHSTTFKRIPGNSSACEPYNQACEIIKKGGL